MDGEDAPNEQVDIHLSSKFSN